MTDTVDAWFDELPEPQGRLLSELRGLIHETNAGFVEAFKWGRPCYSLNHPVCYLQTAKGHVVIGFQQGASRHRDRSFRQQGRNRSPSIKTAGHVAPKQAVTFSRNKRSRHPEIRN